MTIKAKLHPCLLIFYILIFLFSMPLKGQKDTDTINMGLKFKTPNDPEHILFRSDEPLKVTLAFDIRAFIKNRENPKYQDAEITFRFNKEDSLVQHIKLKPGGIFRRSFCFYPPMHLNFKKTEFLGSEPVEQHVIKLIAHCRNERIYSVYVFREYLAYRIYNIISPYSLKVRLLNIDYQDINNPKNRINRYGFLVENAYNLAERTHSVVQKDEKYYRDNLRFDEATRLGVFEYMIGNTDWAAPLLHNIKLLELPGGDRTQVPYDFDYSGFVGTDYALPDPRLGITDVKERLYTGYCAGSELFSRALSEIESHKEEIYKLIQDFDLLNKREKNELLNYLDSFFVLLKDKPALIKILKTRC